MDRRTVEMFIIDKDVLTDLSLKFFNKEIMSHFSEFSDDDTRGLLKMICIMFVNCHHLLFDAGYRN